MTADSKRWRNEAVAVLANALEDGSSMAIAGFGDEKNLDLTLKRLDRNQANDAVRHTLVDRSKKLSSSDKTTYLYEAISQVLEKIKSIDAATLRDAPPALVLLTDFHPDPRPEQIMVKQVCAGIKATGVDLIAAGFGNIDQVTLNYLTGCAGSEPFAPVKSANPQDLVDTFWKVSRRLSRYMQIRELSTINGKSINIKVPDWAREVVVLGRAQEPVSTWNWKLDQPLASYAEGEHFRVARISSKGGKSLSVVTEPSSIRLSIAVAGDALLSLTSPSEQPWLVGEAPLFQAGLISGKSQHRIPEWFTSNNHDYSAQIVFGPGESAPMALQDPEQGVFKTRVVFPQPGRREIRARVTIDGVLWTSPIPMNAYVSPYPIETEPVNGTLKLKAWAWLPGAKSSVKVISALGNRNFNLICRPSPGLSTKKQTIEFGGANHQGSMEFVADTTHRASLAEWFSELKPFEGAISTDVEFAKGKAGGDFSIPVLISFAALWLRLLITSIPLVVLAALLRGRSLPPWRLVPVDSTGRQLPGDGVRLRSFRKSLDLTTIGMPGSRICRGLTGKTYARLGGNARIRPAGSADVPMSGSGRLRLGDIISYRNSDGKDLNFRLERW